MRLLLINSLITILVCCYLPRKAIAQLTENDSEFYQASVKSALSVYHSFLHHPSGLYNGSQYIPYAHLIKDDHPYFRSDSVSIGDIMYDSVLYEHVPMLYDIVKEQVVINDPYNIYTISLIKEKVNGFKVLNHTFIRLEGDSVNGSIIRTGFYDQLYLGKVTLYEKEIKKMQEIIVNQELQRIIYPQNDFYLLINGTYHSINRKGSLLKLLKNRKNDIQQFIRKNRLNYRRDKENTLVKVISYYDGLQAL